jgi:hypothetical protein
MSLDMSNAADRRFWTKAWFGIFGCLGVLDIWRMTKHDESTLSETARHVLRTDTPQGKALFLVLTYAFVRHILK